MSVQSVALGNQYLLYYKYTTDWKCDHGHGQGHTLTVARDLRVPRSVKRKPIPVEQVSEEQRDHWRKLPAVGSSLLAQRQSSGRDKSRQTSCQEEGDTAQSSQTWLWDSEYRTWLHDVGTALGHMTVEEDKEEKK
ncbi:uncharacterized protein LOC106014065 [Aplysia californica]|uniref:Uncharacterized protein LOC106014065 n=1 Tax=Aplysia californica TaxID=6500 RepID=A0ABM1AFA3_APLCA|nr:uncharacterized protein LOC106014065 [Aplysia californica]